MGGHLPNRAKLLRETLDNWLVAYNGWSAVVVVASIVEPMKLSDSKQLTAYTLVCCIAMVPSLPLLTSFVGESLLA